MLESSAKNGEAKITEEGPVRGRRPPFFFTCCSRAHPIFRAAQLTVRLEQGISATSANSVLNVYNRSLGDGRLLALEVKEEPVCNKK